MAAEDKHSRTEDPTPKRKKEARKKGQVARSPDVAGWAAMALAVSILPWFFNLTKGRILGVLTMATQVGRHPSTPGALKVLEAGLKVILVTVGPLGGIFALLAIVATIAPGPAMSGVPSGTRATLTSWTGTALPSLPVSSSRATSRRSRPPAPWSAGSVMPR